jgi:hypothetical protein
VPRIVFPVGADGVYRDDTASTQHWGQNGGDSSHLASGNNEDWSHTDLHDLHVEGDLEWVSDDNGVDASGTGLYWFWDSVWSDFPL